MSYKIAIASSNQKDIDLSFGAANNFLIYEVKDNQTYQIIEVRSEKGEPNEKEKTCESGGCHSVCQKEAGELGNCGTFKADHPKVALISDCRCIICKKIGFSVQKQLEKKAITTFDVEGSIEEVLQKVTLYFHRMDHHQTLRNTVVQN